MAYAIKQYYVVTTGVHFFLPNLSTIRCGEGSSNSKNDITRRWMKCLVIIYLIFRVNIRGFIHVIMLKLRGDENPKDIDFVILGRNVRHISAKRHRDENTTRRRPIRVLSAMKMKNPGIRIKMRGIATLTRISEFINFFAQRQAHAPLPAVARVDRGVGIVVTKNHRN